MYVIEQNGRIDRELDFSELFLIRSDFATYHFFFYQLNVPINFHLCDTADEYQRVLKHMGSVDLLCKKSFVFIATINIYQIFVGIVTKMLSHYLV